MTDFEWPKSHISWIKDHVLYISIPFTWELPTVEKIIRQRSFFWDHIIAGGPALSLIPDYFFKYSWVEVGNYYPDVLQRFNPQATRTSIGCVRKCFFCAVPKTEGRIHELDDWPDNPILIDNNLLACSRSHFDMVIDRLLKFDVVDFNQGLDSRLLKPYHAKRFKELNNPILRLALDNIDYKDQWISAVETLRDAKIPLKNIRSYALFGFETGPDEAWERARFIEQYGVMVLPAWFHELDTLEKNIVTPKQEKLGWNDFKRREILQWFYWHKKAVIYEMPSLPIRRHQGS